MLIVLEAKACNFKLSSTFHIHFVVTVYQNVGDCGVFQQRFEWAKPKNLIQDFARQTLALSKAQGDGFGIDGVPDDQQNFFARGIARGAP